MSDFVHQEFADIDLGDRRRSNRLCILLSRMIQAPMKSIQSACRGWAETMAAYRLLNNPELSVKAILQPHREALIERASQHECIAVIQDTTELDFTKKKSLKGTGPLSKGRRGFLAHNHYVTTPDRLPLGVLDTYIYARSDEDIGAHRKHRPIEEKESFRWLEGYRHACELAAQLPETEVFSISDREGDIFEIYEDWHQRKTEGKSTAQWLIRASQDRALLDQQGNPLKNQDQQIASLFQEVEKGEELGVIEFEIKSRQQRKKVKGTTVTTTRTARRVRQRIKTCKITPRPPYRKGKKLPAVSFWVVLAEEIDPPSDEDPIRWLLLTSKEVRGFEDAQKLLKLYLARWEIEVFHRVLKTGCQVEQIQLQDKEAVLNCTVLNMIVAWRILYLTHLGRECPELPCSVFFEEAEWKSALAVAKKDKIKSAEDFEEPTLGEMLQIVAQLGGHLGRKHDPPPGAQALWQGMLKVTHYAEAWEAFGDRGQ